MFFNDLAHSLAVELVGYIKKLPIYRHEVKRITNLINKEIRNYTLLIKKIGKTDFYSNACDNMAETLNTDLQKLEYTIKFALDKAKIENSELLAKIEITRCMAWGACINVDMRERDIKKELPVTLKDMRLTALARQIENLSNLLYNGKPRTVDFNKDNNCLLAFRIIQKKLLNGHKIADCINRAAGEEEFIISEGTPPRKTPSKVTNPSQ